MIETSFCSLFYFADLLFDRTCKSVSMIHKVHLYIPHLISISYFNPTARKGHQSK